jgi:hypothetical protein
LTLHWSAPAVEADQEVVPAVEARESSRTRLLTQFQQILLFPLQSVLVVLQVLTMFLPQSAVERQSSDQPLQKAEAEEAEVLRQER